MNLVYAASVRARAACLASCAACLAACSAANIDDDVATTLSSTSQALIDAPQDRRSWVHVPGALVHPSCVHEVPNGSEVRSNGDIVLSGAVVAHFDACPSAPIFTKSTATPTGQAPAGQFAELVSTSYSRGFSRIIANFVAPAIPSMPNDNQLIYLFTAIEPTEKNAIMQPVLQWGITNAGGGVIGSYSHWTYASWVGYTDGHFVRTAGFQVNAGDSLEGIVGGQGPSGFRLFGVVSKSLTTGQEDALTAGFPGSVVWTNAFAGVVEPYFINSCSDFPAEPFAPHDVSLYDSATGGLVFPTWSTCAEPSGCTSAPYTGLICGFGVTTTGTGWSMVY
jgi:hypothetical protein